MKYIIHPGYVTASDGDVHFIGFKQLIQLYNLKRSNCYNNDTLGDTSGLMLDGCTHLYPREDGNYNLPKEEANDNV